MQDLMYKHDFSYGIIPFRYFRKKYQLLLIQHADGGHWGFPKGHADPGEQPLVAAERELNEETGLKVERFFEMGQLEETYFFRFHGNLYKKKVVYFVGEVKGRVKIQKGEISDFRWCSFEEAKELATFSQTKMLCHQVSILIAEGCLQ